jgi:hypothetical protein
LSPWRQRRAESVDDKIAQLEAQPIAMANRVSFTKTDSMDSVSLNGDVKEWRMHPKDNDDASQRV